MSDLTFEYQGWRSSPASAFVSYDKTGRVPGIAPQQTSIRDCVFNGNGRMAVGFQLCRAGGTAQGDTIVWNNCGFFGCVEAGLRIGTPTAYATNAISNTVLNGDFQCPKYGAAIYGGQVSFYDTHFESAPDQVVNGGADVIGIASGGDPSVMTNCRSENLILSRGVPLSNGHEATGCVGILTNCITLGAGIPQWPATRTDGLSAAGGRLVRSVGPGPPSVVEFDSVRQFGSMRFCRLSYGRVFCDWRQCVEMVGNTLTNPDWEYPQHLVQTDGNDARHLSYGTIVTGGTVYGGPAVSRPEFRLHGETLLTWRGGMRGVTYPPVGFAPVLAGALAAVGNHVPVEVK